MYQLYPEQIPSEVRIVLRNQKLYSLFLFLLLIQIEKRGREIAKGFQKDRFATKRELNLLSRLIADANQIFPPDFVSATVTKITETARTVFGKNQLY